MAKLDNPWSFRQISRVKAIDGRIPRVFAKIDDRELELDINVILEDNERVRLSRASHALGKVIVALVEAATGSKFDSVANGRQIDWFRVGG